MERMTGEAHWPLQTRCDQTPLDPDSPRPGLPADIAQAARKTTAKKTLDKLILRSSISQGNAHLEHKKEDPAMSMAAALERTAPLYQRVKSVIPPIEWPVFAEDIDAILRLKQQRNAVILAHNYMPPEIFHCAAD